MPTPSALQLCSCALQFAIQLYLAAAQRIPFDPLDSICHADEKEQMLGALQPLEEHLDLTNPAVRPLSQVYAHLRKTR